MIIDVDLYGKIRHMYVQQKMSQRAIAKELGISRNTVKKYCQGDHVPWERKPYQRESRQITEPVKDFIRQCFDHDLKENLPKQSHTARQIYKRLVQEKGFTGAESTVRRIVRQMRPSQKEAFVPLEFDPGEAAQVDWGEATVYIEGERTRVQLFCYRLCYSADIFVKAFYRQNRESFLEGHIEAFAHTKGVPRAIIFDNAKVAVKEGFGLYARPQAAYQAFSAHYAFQTRFCNINSGNEKGLVENLVGWIRRNVLVPVPRVKNIEDLNQTLIEECLKYRLHRIEGRKETVREQYLTEKQALTALPAFTFDAGQSLTVRVAPSSLVRFDKNEYSVPVHLVGLTIGLKAYGNHLSCYFRGEEVARHTRYYGKRRTFFQLEHYLPLLEQKPRSVFNAKPVRQSTARELLEWGRTFPEGARDTVALLRLSVDYGLESILAVRDALPQGISPTIELLRNELASTKPARLDAADAFFIKPLDLSRYDEKYGVVAR